MNLKVRRVRGVVRLTFSVLLFGALLVSFTPVHAVGFQVKDQPPILLDAVPGPTGPPQSMTIRVELTADGSVIFTGPRNIPAATLLAGASSDGFDVSAADPSRLSANESGSWIVMSGSYSSVGLRFVTGPQAGEVAISVNDGPVTTLLLESEIVTERAVAINASSYDVAATRFMWQQQRIRFASPVSGVELATLGQLAVDHSVLVDDSGQQIGVVIERGAVVRALLGAISRFLPLLAFAVAILVGSAIIGRGAERILIRWADAPIDWLTATILGLSVALLAVGTLNYVLSVRQASLLLSPMLLASIHPARRAFQRRRTSWPQPTRLMALGMALTAVIAYPLILSGGFSVGFLQTDVVDTFRLTQVFWNNSAFDANLDFGNGFRLLDQSARALVAGWSATPNAAVVIYRLVFLALLIPVSWRLSTSAGVQGWRRDAVVSLTVASGAIVSLFAEGYMSRTFFAWFLLLGAGVLGRAVTAPSVNRLELACGGLVLAVAAAVVPPFMMLLPVVGLMLVVRSGWPRSGLQPVTKLLSPFVVAWSVGALPNFIWLRNAGEAQRYIEALNAIGRDIVVPFYAEPTFPAALIGLVPFHSNRQHWMGEASVGVAPGLARSFSDWFLGTNVALGFLALVGVAAVWTAVAQVRRAKQPDERALAVLWIGSVGAIIGGGLLLWVLFWSSQSYFVLMWFWTLAPLGVAALALGFARGAVTTKMAGRTFSVVLGLLLVTNLSASLLETSRWFESPRGSTADRTHLDIVHEVEAFTQYLVSDTGSIGPHMVAGPPSDLTGTDDDRVLGNLLDILLVADGSACIDCAYDPDVKFLHLAPVPRNEVVSVIVGGGECETEEMYRAARFVMCTAAPDGPD